MPQSALLLGSGFVATPTVDVLSNAGVHVTVACRTLSSARKLASDFTNTNAVGLDVNDTSALEDAIAKHDITISLIPYTCHVAVVKAAIKAKKHVVTTSYVSPALQALDEEAKAAGITVMNEIGVNEIRYLENGESKCVSGGDLMDTAKPYHTGFLGFNFVAYGNRDSTVYRERYNIPEAQTVMRGTLRYAGFPELIKVLFDIGFLNEREEKFLKEPIAWKEATKRILGASSSSEKDLVWAISSKTTFKNTDDKNRLVAALKWRNPLDTLCATLEEKMAYKEGERDFVFLQHKFEIENKNGSRDTITSTLSEYGAPIGTRGYSAMAKLVGVTCAVGKSSSAAKVLSVKQVLDGTISGKGILAPMTPSINRPLMQELKEKHG
ncbi:uncharacterized protein KY384_009074 [Bacidia gigantensis]|uniref:uncharacterized protein n=1 Tax=Bacidia gigantensis TaxID=2732470 RepID=UPI001D0384F4|nr:uncharacterized protein KY384_009074 [Bacidia gigantensis]KAG8525430.1 hypothetical protein KY384_009074 [Bacidia gigantensis]